MFEGSLSSSRDLAAEDISLPSGMHTKPCMCKLHYVGIGKSQALRCSEDKPVLLYVDKASGLQSQELVGSLPRV